MVLKNKGLQIFWHFLPPDIQKCGYQGVRNTRFFRKIFCGLIFLLVLSSYKCWPETNNLSCKKTNSSKVLRTLSYD